VRQPCDYPRNIPYWDLLELLDLMENKGEEVNIALAHRVITQSLRRLLIGR